MLDPELYNISQLSTSCRRLSGACCKKAGVKFKIRSRGCLPTKARLKLCECPLCQYILLGDSFWLNISSQARHCKTGTPPGKHFDISIERAQPITGRALRGKLALAPGILPRQDRSDRLDLKSQLFVAD